MKNDRNNRTDFLGGTFMGWVISHYNNGDEQVTYISIDSIDSKFEKFIDGYIAKICYGSALSSVYSVDEAKKYIEEFITTEKDERRKIGAISEFFLHLYLNSKGYIQECAFTNLEEPSFKKGFDGVYKDANNDIWYMESKSGDEKSCNHIGKIREAYKDLEKKFTANVENDPWQNAINHVMVTTQDKSLIGKFHSYSVGFKKGTANRMEDFNIIPSGTVYGSGKTSYDGKTISDNVFNYFKTRDKKGLYAICVTNTSVAQFKAYLGK